MVLFLLSTKNERPVFLTRLSLRSLLTLTGSLPFPSELSYPLVTPIFLTSRGDSREEMRSFKRLQRNKGFFGLGFYWVFFLILNHDGLLPSLSLDSGQHLILTEEYQGLCC